MSTSTPIIELSNVQVQLGDRDILKSVSATMNEGDFVYLVGRSGSGKSTLLRLLYADQQHQAGEVRVDQFQLKTINPKEIPFLRRKLGIIFQDYQLLSDRDVSQNLQFVLKATGWTRRRDIKRRINEVLLQVGMTGRSQAMPHQLSGGEQQRVAIARALLNSPALIIADEPTGNLDPHAAQHVMGILREINYLGTAILMATHEYGLINDYPGRVIELQDGQAQLYEESSDFLEAYRSRLR